MDLQFIESTKGTLLVKDANTFTYYFYKDNTSKDVSSYRCTQKRSKNCPAVAKVNKDEKKILEIVHSHNHGVDILYVRF